MNNKKQWDAIWINAILIPCEGSVDVISQAAIAVRDGKMTWLGAVNDLPDSPLALADHVHDAKGAFITPGFIDCHTHLVYAGNRANEFAERLQGKTYEEIAKAGGGIQSTVCATRTASEEQLFNESIKRAADLLHSGVTTLEIKSGYGLDKATELKMLRVAKRIENHLPMTVHTTYLGAHTVPLEYKENPQDYIEFVCNEMIPLIAEEKLADAVDVFCENIAFNLQQAERVFKAAKEYELKIKCHAEQLSDSGAAALAANYQALSVDHLEYISEASLKRLQTQQTVAVLLPGAYYFLREKQLPPVARLRELGIPIAIASDCNPGTSPVTSMLSVMNLACTLFRLTPDEALLAVTQVAAKALGILHSHGTLAVGKAADFVLWDIKHPAELSYYLGHDPVLGIVKAGKVITYKEMSDGIDKRRTAAV